MAAFIKPDYDHSHGSPVLSRWLGTSQVDDLTPPIPVGADEEVQAAALFANGLSSSYSVEEFERKLRIWFGLILGKFTDTNRGMDQIAFATIEKARQEGWLRLLIQRVREDRPRNLKLIQVCKQAIEVVDAVKTAKSPVAPTKPQMDSEVKLALIVNYTLLSVLCIFLILWTYVLWGWTISSAVAGITAIAGLIKAIGPFLPANAANRIALLGARYLVQRRTAYFVGVALAIVGVTTGFIGTVEVRRLPQGVTEVELA